MATYACILTHERMTSGKQLLHCRACRETKRNFASTCLQHRKSVTLKTRLKKWTGANRIPFLAYLFQTARRAYFVIPLPLWSIPVFYKGGETVIQLTFTYKNYDFSAPHGAMVRNTYRKAYKAQLQRCYSFSFCALTILKRYVYDRIQGNNSQCCIKPITRDVMLKPLTAMPVQLKDTGVLWGREARTELILLILDKASSFKVTWCPLF